VQMTYVGAFKSYEKLLFIDVDAAPVNQLANYAGVDGWSVTQELRFSGATDVLDWVVGFYYLHIDSFSDNGLKAPQNSLPALFGFGGAPTDIGVQAELITDSFNLFGQLEYQLTDQLSFTLGARVIQEEKDFELLQGLFASQSVFTVNQGAPFATLNTFDDEIGDTLWSGKAQLDWRPNDDLLFYGGVRRGVKAASFNAPIPGGVGFPNSLLPYDEEVLLTFEGGFKATLFDGTTRINGSIYYNDYEDYQAFLFTGVAGIVLNLDQEAIGGELTIQSSPVQGLNLQLGVSAIDAEVKDLPLLIGTSLPTRDVEPTYTPEFTVSGMAGYEWPALGGMLNTHFDFSYSDEFFYNLRNFEADKFDSYVLINGEIGWTSRNEHWNLRFMVNNITDEEAGVQGFNLATLCGCNEISFRPPRWYGLQVGYEF